MHGSSLQLQAAPQRRQLPPHNPADRHGALLPARPHVLSQAGTCLRAAQAAPQHWKAQRALVVLAAAGPTSSNSSSGSSQPVRPAAVSPSQVAAASQSPPGSSPSSSNAPGAAKQAAGGSSKTVASHALPWSDDFVEGLQREAQAHGYGTLYAAMGGGVAGLEACAAVEALCKAVQPELRSQGAEWRWAQVVRFVRWARRHVPGAAYMNPLAPSQLRQLLYPAHNRVPGRPDSPAPALTFPVAGTTYLKWEAEQAGGDGGGAEAATAELPKEFELRGVYPPGSPGLAPHALTGGGAPDVGPEVLRVLAGKPGAARKALEALALAGGEAEGKGAHAGAGKAGQSGGAGSVGRVRRASTRSSGST
mmetsp:Transcript_30971/g.79013  ORF Transcript_30971/g.79013 Transcript_30971/m.79013 type:complete len:363 (-) Transcript_30971:132-1220(-)